MSKMLFIADLHFGHKNALSFDNRPYASIEEHDNDLIKRWNDVVDIDDLVWILGDISWHGPMKTIEIFNQLNGIKNLCIGNHDKKLLRNKDVRDLFCEITNYKEVGYNPSEMIVLSHWPIICFNNHYYGANHLYGHVHNGFEWNMMEHSKKEMVELYNKPCNMYNVGCMINYMNYAPKTLEEIINGAKNG